MAMLNNQMVSWASLWVSVFSVRFRSFGATACIASCGSTHLSQLLGFTTFLDAPVLRGTTVQRYNGTWPLSFSLIIACTSRNLRLKADPQFLVAFLIDRSFFWGILQVWHLRKGIFDDFCLAKGWLAQCSNMAGWNLHLCHSHHPWGATARCSEDHDDHSLSADGFLPTCKVILMFLYTRLWRSDKLEHLVNMCFFDNWFDFVGVSDQNPGPFLPISSDIWFGKLSHLLAC